jgi:outer membrane biosynthesis protein TonB
MWLWQLRAKRKTVFLGKIVIFTSILHFFALVFMFFLYKGDNFIFNVDINTCILAEADIVYLPLQKVAENIKKKPVIEKMSTAKKMEKKKPIKKSEPKKMTTLTKAEVIKKKPTPIKKTIPKKKEIKKEVKNKAKKIIKKENKSKRTTQAQRDPRRKTKQERQPVYIGRHDLQALRLQEMVQGEVEKHWNSPVGFSKDLSCVIKVFVGWNGSIENISVKESSGVLIYDVSARMAISKLKMPPMAKGKEINITFNNNQ